MLIPVYTTTFAKDLKRMLKRGKDGDKIKLILSLLLEQSQFPSKYQDHKLKGSFEGRRECHVEPDWLLIYCVKGSDLILERTGSHSDLFG